MYNAWRAVLRELRRRQRLSQKEAAGNAGVDAWSWSRWESGTHLPRPGRAARIAEALGLSAERLAFEYARLLYRHCKRNLNDDDKGELVFTRKTKPEPNGSAPNPETPEDTVFSEPEKGDLNV